MFTGKFEPVTLQSQDGHKSQRMIFEAVDTLTLATMKAGYLVKMKAGSTDTVQPAVSTDNAALDGIIVDLPNVDDPDLTDTGVMVAFSGSFDKNTVKYADGTDVTAAAALNRLRDVGIFLDAATPAGDYGL